LDRRSAGRLGGTEALKDALTSAPAGSKPALARISEGRHHCLCNAPADLIVAAQWLLINGRTGLVLGTAELKKSRLCRSCKGVGGALVPVALRGEERAALLQEWATGFMDVAECSVNASEPDGSVLRAKESAGASTDSLAWPG